jgi:hypothetical protein
MPQIICNLTEPEKRLQRIIKEIGKNEPTFMQERAFTDAWNAGIDLLKKDGLNLAEAGKAFASGLRTGAG